MTDGKINKRNVGSRYERLAAAFLVYSGYRIIDRNFRTRVSEVDIIAEENGVICFVEVKYRRGLLYGTPAEAVNIHKQTRIAAAARQYISRSGLYDRRVRFDVVEIIGSRIRIIRDAFDV